MKDQTLLLTAAQLAQEIQVSRRSVGLWTASRKIPAIKLGRRCVRYDLQQVREALRKFTQEAIS